MKRLFTLLLILFTFSIFAKDRKVWSPDVNSNYIIGVNDSGSFVEAVKANRTQVIINGISSIKTDALLSEDYFPDTTDLYGWHINGVGNYDDGDWIGSKALANNNVLTVSTNHLGQTVYSHFNGFDDYLSSSDPVFTNNTNSFTVAAWIKPDTLTNGAVILSKYDSSGSFRSWRIYFTATAARFSISTTAQAGGGATDTEFPTDGLDDGRYHHIAGVYDKDATSILVMVDGKIVAYAVNAAFSGIHDDGLADFMVGASTGGSGVTGFFTGDITDVIYKKDALTYDELLKMYAAGSKKFVSIDGNSKVSILDGRCNLGSYRIKPADKTLSVSKITETSLYIPADGIYKYIFNARVRVVDTDASGDANIQFKIYDNTNDVDLTETKVPGFSGATASEGQQTIGHIETPPMYFTKDTQILMNVTAITGTDTGYFSDMDIWWEKLD